MYNIYCLRKGLIKSLNYYDFMVTTMRKSSKESNNKDYKMYKQFPEREDLGESILSDICVVV